MELSRACKGHVSPVVTFGQGSSLEEERGGSLLFRRAVRRLADPNGVLNPG